MRIAALPNREPLLVVPIKKNRIHKVKRIETNDPKPRPVNMARLRREVKALDRIDIRI